jgi:hypothetical protein
LGLQPIEILNVALQLDDTELFSRFVVYGNMNQVPTKLLNQYNEWAVEMLDGNLLDKLISVYNEGRRALLASAICPDLAKGELEHLHLLIQTKSSDGGLLSYSCRSAMFFAACRPPEQLRRVATGCLDANSAARMVAIARQREYRAENIAVLTEFTHIEDDD